MATISNETAISESQSLQLCLLGIMELLSTGVLSEFGSGALLS